MDEAKALLCLYCGAPRDVAGATCTRCGADAPTVPCMACGVAVPAPNERCVCGALCPAWADPEGAFLPCPRCNGALARVALDIGTMHVEQCARCLGCFVRADQFSELVGQELAGKAVGLRHFVPLPPGRELPRQTLLGLASCPHCRGEMERTRFANEAGLVVDVCPRHGMWLDAGELVAVVNFMQRRASGDLRPGAATIEEEQHWTRIAEAKRAEAAVVGRHVDNVERLDREWRRMFQADRRDRDAAVWNAAFGALDTWKKL